MKRLILPAAITVTILLLVLLPPFLIKAKITCESQFGECPQAVIDQISSVNGKRMFFANGELKKKLKGNYMVSNFSIQFKLPNILKVDLIAKKPVFALKNSNSGIFALTDKDGIVLATSDRADIPSVTTGEALPTVGEKVSEQDLLALNLIDGVYKMYQTGTGSIDGETLLVELPGSIRVIFPLVDADRDLLLGSLRLIYSNIENTQGGSPYTQIDLRYKNPVLR